MDNPTTLLVAIMFVTILGLAIGNVLMTCAEIAGGLRHPMPDRLHLSWILLMLLALLNLFWETTTILDIENWLFIEFLYVIAGPMVLLFATSVITAPAQTERSSEGQSYYFELCKRYFVMLALHEVWIIGIDYLYAAQSMNTLLSAALLILFVVLAVSTGLRVHITGASLAWTGYVVSVALRTLDTMGGQ